MKIEVKNKTSIQLSLKGCSRLREKIKGFSSSSVRRPTFYSLHKHTSHVYHTQLEVVHCKL
jgi:hypothetical protein